MAHRLTLARLLAAAAGLALSAGSTAQALTDPTRPPLQLMMSAAGVDKAGAEEAPERPRLESILLSSARRGAIINGQYVALGGSYGKAVMVDISATAVTLKTGKELEVLQLYPPRGEPAATSGTEHKTEEMVKRP